MLVGRAGQLGGYAGLSKWLQGTSTFLRLGTPRMPGSGPGSGFGAAAEHVVVTPLSPIQCPMLVLPPALTAYPLKKAMATSTQPSASIGLVMRTVH